jgi:hypothetical protein
VDLSAPITLADVHALDRCLTFGSLDDLETCFDGDDRIACSGGDSCSCIGCGEARGVRQLEEREPTMEMTTTESADDAQYRAYCEQIGVNPDEQPSLQNGCAPRPEQVPESPEVLRHVVQRGEEARRRVREAGYDPDAVIRGDEPWRYEAEAELRRVEAEHDARIEQAVADDIFSGRDVSLNGRSDRALADARSRVEATAKGVRGLHDRATDLAAKVAADHHRDAQKRLAAAIERENGLIQAKRLLMAASGKALGTSYKQEVAGSSPAPPIEKIRWKRRDQSPYGYEFGLLGWDSLVGAGFTAETFIPAVAHPENG